ncbi:hypothetical protein [Nitrosomonas sp.]|uniref:IS66 family insertion sequence element accessory protein TnpA n=1 Tax=Nitrosomonas sp. TaxID=42353 RepID=UPI0025FCB17A|nr:hypothetical protein [Nitrosomonas sp.]
MMTPIIQSHRENIFSASPEYTESAKKCAYCRQCKLNSKTFSNWLRFYRSEQVATTTPTLIPVEIKSIASSFGALCLRCPQGHALELPADVSGQKIFRVRNGKAESVGCNPVTDTQRCR